MSNRATALHVVEHFKVHRVGRTSCQILDELAAAPTKQQQQQQQQRQQQQPPQHPVPLRAYVEAAAPKAAPLLDKLLSAWVLVPDVATAVAALPPRGQASRGGAVTLAGEVFKSDGEIVVRAGNVGAVGGRARAHDIGHNTHSFVAPAASRQAPDAASEQERKQQQHGDHAALQAAARQVSQLESSVERAGSEVAALERVLLDARQLAAQWQRSAARATGAVAAAKAALQQRQQSSARAARAAQAAAQQAAAAADNASVLQRRAKALAARACAAASAEHGGEVSALAECSAAQAEAEAVLQAAEHDARRAANLVASLKKQLAKDASARATAEVERLQVAASRALLAGSLS